MMPLYLSLSIFMLGVFQGTLASLWLADKLGLSGLAEVVLIVVGCVGGTVVAYYEIRFAMRLLGKG